MIDEPSLGLAPLMIDEVFALLKELKASGTTLLIVEPNTRVCARYRRLWLCDGENGRIVLEGAARNCATTRTCGNSISGLILKAKRKELSRHQALSASQALAWLSAPPQPSLRSITNGASAGSSAVFNHLDPVGLSRDQRGEARRHRRQHRVAIRIRR